MTVPGRSSPLEVVVSGGGVAALELVLALRELAPNRVSITMVAPEADFTYRPPSTAEPFALGYVARYTVRRLTDDVGARLRVISHWVRPPFGECRERWRHGVFEAAKCGSPLIAAKQGSPSIRIGLGWAKSHSFTTGQCPVMRYHRQLMNAILNDRAQIAKAVNATVISLDDAPNGYRDFDGGMAKKFVLDPHGMLGGKHRVGA